MSEPNRTPRVLRRDRRTFTAGALVVATAAAVAAMLSAGAEARSQIVPVNNTPPTISGTPVVGETLVTSEGSWTPAPDQVAYEWQSCDAAGENCVPVGMNSNTYVIAGTDLGKTIRVEVTAFNGADSASALSAATAGVTEPTAPVNTAEPVISGSTVEGSTLNVTTGTWNGVGTITYVYRWVRCNADGGLPDGSNCPSIDGATSSSYQLTVDDIGKRLRVRVTASNAAGFNTVASNATATVTQSTTTGPLRNTAEPSISGTPTVGRTLFASTGTWAGQTPITFTYQWVRCNADGGLPDGSNCESISGATTSSYIPSSTDVGRPLRVRVVASNSLGTQTVASNATAAIQTSTTTTTQQSPRNSVLPSILGSTNVGATLTASVGLWTGTAPLLYAYQWMRCDADGSIASCTDITGATSTQFVPTSADQGRRIRVEVTARNTLGTATATSNATAQVQAAGSGGTPTTPTTPTPPTNLPSGAVRLPSGTYSIPVTSVSPPERLVAGAFAFTPETVRSRERPIVLRVRVVDTRGYAVRDALVFVRSTPLVTSSPGEVRTGRDGWARVLITPRADFPLDGKSVQFFVRVRKQGEALLAGVSTRRLVQVATAG